MAWIWVVTIAVLVLALLLHSWALKNHTRAKNLPPGPRGFPIFGSLHLLGKLPHRDLHRLSQKYGPIMHMRLGLVPTIIVSSPHAAELFLKTHDHVFASRPLIHTVRVISYDQKDLVFAPYGSYWRKMRRMCTLELFSPLKISSFKSMRKNELGLLIDHLREASRARVAVGLSSKISSLSADMTCLMVFGKKYTDEEFGRRGFKAVVKEAMQLAIAPNLADYVPCIAALDLQGLNRRAKFVGKEFDGFLERIIEEHLESKDEDRTKDFVDAMLELMGSQETEYQIERSNIKAMALDMLAAAMDTSATAIDWAVAELIKHPQAMRKLQVELEKVVGLNRRVEESDLSHLEYLNMVIKEVLRLHPPAPLLVPHESLEECIVDGFHIPNKSRILVNAWSIGQDPNTWMDPEKFFPERFIDNQVDVKGRDFHLIPFGSGRRACPGLQLGLIIVPLVVAQLIHCFDWELLNNMLPTELDMAEDFGLTCPRAQELTAIPIYRLYN